MKPYEVVATVRSTYPHIMAARKRTATVAHAVVHAAKVPVQILCIVLAVTIFLGFFFGIHAYQVYVQHHTHAFFKAHPHTEGEMPLIVGIVWASVWGGAMLIVATRRTWLWMSGAEYWPWEDGHRPWQKLPTIPAQPGLGPAAPPIRSTREWAP